MYIELSNVSQRYFEIEVTGVEEDEVCLIIRTKEPVNENLTNKVLKLIEESQEAVFKNLNISFS